MTSLQPAAVPQFLEDAEMGISAMLAPQLLWKAGQSLHSVVRWPAAVLSSKAGGTAVPRYLDKVAHFRAVVLSSTINHLLVFHHAVRLRTWLVDSHGWSTSVVVNNHGSTVPVTVVSGWCIAYPYFRHMAAAVFVAQWRDFGPLHLVLRLNYLDPCYLSCVRETVLALASR